MSSEKFEEHEEEFRSYYGELDKIIKNRISQLSGEPRKREIRNAQKLTEEAELQIEQMVDEAQSAPAAYRARLMGKTRSYRSQLDKQRKELEKLRHSSVVNVPYGDRNDLLGTGVANHDPNIAQRNKMIEGLDSLNRGSESVARSQRIAAETDEVGVGIIGDLDQQREQLHGIRDRVKETDTDLGRSRRILTSMSLRLATNKILLSVIIIIELVILGAVVYLRFFKKKK